VGIFVGGVHARCWVLKAQPTDRDAGTFRVSGVAISGCSFLALMPRQTGSVAGGVRLYFENYTVDASILKKKRTQIDLF
jgi:hypothetical protein